MRELATFDRRQDYGRTVYVRTGDTLVEISVWETLEDDLVLRPWSRRCGRGMKQVQTFNFPGAHEPNEVVPMTRRTKVIIGVGLVLAGLVLTLNVWGPNTRLWGSDQAKHLRCDQLGAPRGACSLGYSRPSDTSVSTPMLCEPGP